MITSVNSVLAQTSTDWNIIELYNETLCQSIFDLSKSWKPYSKSFHEKNLVWGLFWNSQPLFSKIKSNNQSASRILNFPPNSAPQNSQPQTAKITLSHFFLISTSVNFWLPKFRDLNSKCRPNVSSNRKKPNPKMKKKTLFQILTRTNPTTDRAVDRIRTRIGWKRNGRNLPKNGDHPTKNGKGILFKDLF